MGLIAVYRTCTITLYRVLFCIAPVAGIVLKTKKKKLKKKTCLFRTAISIGR